MEGWLVFSPSYKLNSRLRTVLASITGARSVTFSPRGGIMANRVCPQHFRPNLSPFLPPASIDFSTLPPFSHDIHSANFPYYYRNPCVNGPSSQNLFHEYGFTLQIFARWISPGETAKSLVSNYNLRIIRSRDPSPPRARYCPSSPDDIGIESYIGYIRLCITNFMENLGGTGGIWKISNVWERRRGKAWRNVVACIL